MNNIGGLVLFCFPPFFGGRHQIDTNAGNMTWALILTTIHLTLEHFFCFVFSSLKVTNNPNSQHHV